MKSINERAANEAKLWMMRLIGLFDELGGLRAARRHWLRPKKRTTTPINQFMNNKSIHNEWSERKESKPNQLMNERMNESNDWRCLLSLIERNGGAPRQRGSGTNNKWVYEFVGLWSGVALPSSLFLSLLKSKSINPQTKEMSWFVWLIWLISLLYWICGLWPAGRPSSAAAFHSGRVALPSFQLLCSSIVLWKREEELTCLSLIAELIKVEWNVVEWLKSCWGQNP